MNNTPNNTPDKIEFNFTCYALKLLGQNLYSNPWTAVSEIVANGIDAKANNIYILVDLFDKDSAQIEVIDDGYGMTYHDLCEKYTIIGRNKKTNKIEKLTINSGSHVLTEYSPDPSLPTLVSGDPNDYIIEIAGGELTIDFSEFCGSIVVKKGGKLIVGENTDPDNLAIENQGGTIEYAADKKLAPQKIDGGISWRQSNAIPSDDYRNVVYFNGTMVVIGAYGHNALYSTDGKTWTSFTYPAGTGQISFGVAGQGKLLYPSGFNMIYCDAHPSFV